MIKNGLDKNMVNINSNFTHKMKVMAEELALSNLALFPRYIWLKVFKEMSARSIIWNGLHDKSVFNMVGNV